MASKTVKNHLEKLPPPLPISKEEAKKMRSKLESIEKNLFLIYLYLRQKA